MRGDIMADYESMYYELFVAVERAMKNLEDAVLSTRKIYQTDKDKAYFSLIQQYCDIFESLRQAQLKCEDIYIETCEPDPELEAEIDAFLATPFYPPN